ncbi:Protein FAM65B [Armadillidium vulgare]|nr:Protein FAM65B [Armadillidium vulgare]
MSVKMLKFVLPPNSILFHDWMFSICLPNAREGVELWELGETLGGVVGDLTGPTHSAHSFPITSSTGSETSSSGSSCSSASVRRTPIHSALTASSHGLHSRSPWEDIVEDFDEEPGDIMSLRERDPQFGSLRQGLTRSRSFGGLLMTPNSGRRSLGSGTLRAGWAGMGVLGQGTPPSPRDLRRMGSLPPHVKVPKAPRPQRASLVAGAVAKGVRDCVGVTRKDLFALTRAQHDYKRAKQMKAAERYLKRLEFLLSQIEDLHDQYSLNQRLRDGVRTMAYAYALSPGKEKASALSNVRSGYRECTETLCNLEVQIEQLIGIQGFARLCPGDVFEVSIKHGSQKWKTKGRIAKDNSQVWDNPMFIFKALIGEMLQIKAMEVRLLGKTVIIGNKLCETKDLFSPHPQLMTVNLNPSGSLKLNVIITWNPLDGGSEDTLVRTPSISGPSPRGNRKSVIHSLSSSPPQEKSLGSTSKELVTPECDQDSSFGSMSARSSTADSASPMSEYRGLPSSKDLSTRTDSNSPVSDIQALGLSRRADSHESVSFDERDSASPQCDDTGNFTLVRKEESRVEQWARYSQYNVSQASSLDIMSRSFPNLSSHSPYSHSPHTHSPNSPAQSQVLSQSLSHQLNLLTAAEQDQGKWADPQTWDCTVPSTLPKVVSRLRTCLEDIQGQFPQLHSLEEAVLELHDMCKDLGSFGPLRKKRQMLEELVRQMTDSEIYSDCLTVTAGHFLAHLVKPLQETVPHISASLNCSSLLAQRDPNSIEKGLSLLNIPNVLHTKLISQHFLGPLEYSSLVTSYINKIKNIDEALSALFDNCLLLLESTSPSERSAASTLLGHIFPLLPSKKEEKSNKDNKNEIIKEGKNSNDDAILDVKETPKTNDDKKESSSIGQNDNISISKSIPNPIHKIPKRNDFAHPIAILSFLQQNDPSQEVRNSARLSLLNLGSQGQEALHQVQLSSHGFQGLAVKEGREKTKT